MFTITEEKIIETAEALKAAGKNPTQVTVREALGGGSFATIGPALKRWKDGQKEEHALAEIQVPQAVTERLEQLQGAVWQAAVDEAERRLIAEREALKAAQDAAAAEVAEQLESVAMLEAEAEQLRQQIDSMEKAATTQAITVQSLEDELADVKDQARDDTRIASEAFTKEASRAEAAIARAERAEALHEKAQTQTCEDREAAAKQTRADLAEQKKAHDAEIGKLNKAIKEAQDAAAAAVKKAEAAETAALEKAAKLEKEVQQRSANEQACQARLEAAQRDAELTQKRVTKLEEKADKAVQEAAELRGELKSLKRAKG